MKLDNKTLFLWLASLSTCTHGYELTGSGDITLTDSDTDTPEIMTIFTDEPTLVTVSGIEWGADTSATTLTYETFVNGKSAATGEIELDGEALPDKIEAGTIKVGDRGKTTIRVELKSGESTAESSGEWQAFGKGVALIPLLVVLGFAITTQMVEFSLFSAIFVGSCIIEGNINDGFKQTLENFLLNAVADIWHGYVILFTLFLSGLVGMMERSGGMIGFTRDVAKFATTSRSGQMCAFAVGCFVFFDDYANTLLAGGTMRPLLDVLSVSREKLAFIVDATAAPIASISPVSSWVGFEIGLIEDEIARLIAIHGEENLRINTSGMAVFLQSIKYRYYPIFMIVMMIVLIYGKRDFGTMLVAERKTQVYKRTDGGDGKLNHDSSSEGSQANQPKEDTPMKSWNMVFPVLLLVFFIFYLLVKTGEREGEDQTLMKKIESADSYQALLWGTMATAICTALLYFTQIVQDGELVGLSKWFSSLVAMVKAPTVDGKSKPRFLMSLSDNMESFIHGMARVFPAIIVLNLAWAVGSVMRTVGADRLFARWILGGIDYELLPTLSFIISLLMALATGTSWGTMSILFPMVLVPTYNASGGDPTIFYATTAGILSGSVAGDHVSPISDTTVLSALACDCNLLSHVSTQMGYSIVVSLISILVGTIPIGYDAWPNIIGILLGVALVVCFVFFVCAPVLSETGRFDLFTELYLKFKKNEELDILKEDTIKAFNGEDVSSDKYVKALEDDSKSSQGAEKSDLVAAQEEGAVDVVYEAEA